MGVEFVIALTDQLSGPAALMGKSLLTTANAADIVDKQIQTTSKALTRAFAAGDTAKVESLSAKMNTLGESFESLGGQSAKGADNLAASLGELLTPAAAAEAALAAVAVVAGLLFGGAKMALEAAEFKKSTLASFSALTGSAAAGAQTLDTIRALEGSVPESEATLVDRAKGLLAQGIDPKKLQATLLSMSNVAAAIGDQGAQKIQSVMEKSLTSGKFQLSAKQLVGTGVTEDDLAKALGMSKTQMLGAIKAGTITAEKGIDALNAAVNAKLGGVAADKAGDFGSQMTKLHDNIGQLFEDVNIQPFLQGLKGLLSIFSKDSVEGGKMKIILTALFDKVFKIGAAILPKLHLGLLQLGIAALRIYIAAKPLIDQLSKLWDSMGDGNATGDALMFVLDSATAMIIGMVKATELVVGGVNQFIDSMRGLGAVFGSTIDLGKNFITGLLDGLDFTAIIAKVKNGAQAVIDTVKSTLGIHSPSTVMMELGAHTATGMAQGIDAGAQSVQAAAGGLATGAATGAAAGPASAMRGSGASPDASGGGGSSGGGGAPASGSSGGGGVSVNVMPGAITITGGSGDAATTLTENALALIFERIALTQGLGQ